MRGTYRWLAVGALVAFSASLKAQQEVVVDFCDPMPDPAACTEDTLEVTFGDDPDDSIFEIADPFVVDTPVPVVIVSNTVNMLIQGWSYGVKHDTNLLSLDPTSVTIQGTEAETQFNTGFNRTVAVLPADTAPGDPRACVGTCEGFISAVVLSFVSPAQLPVGQRNSIARASYTLTAEPGANGTLIEIVSGELRPAMGSPPADINITINGAAKLPLTIVQGLLIGAGGPGAEMDCADGVDNDMDGLIDCADPDCAMAANCRETNCTDMIDNDMDGQTDCDDTDCAMDAACVGDCPDYAFYFGDAASAAGVAAGDAATLAIGQRNVSAGFAFSLGVSYQTAGGVTTYQFSDQVGTAANNTVELIITTEMGGEVETQIPVTPNTATANNTPVNVTRGMALSGFAPNTDFFTVELMPEVGGPGFFVGYVADLAGNNMNEIAATPAENCPLNEILLIQLTGKGPGGRFARGDADGNNRINVSDATIIIQVAAMNINPVFDCDEALDTDNNGQVNISDALPVLAWVFQRGPRLAAPFLACGTDDDADAVTCNANSPNCN
ncbi:MAG: hypothetical protein O7J95_03495 [Planctomycetota bacterium]|nr:hypothetical protein [Planctomycetota bacterium]